MREIINTVYMALRLYYWKIVNPQNGVRKTTRINLFFFFFTVLRGSHGPLKLRSSGGGQKKDAYSSAGEE